MRTEEAREEIRKLMYEIAVDAAGEKDVQRWDEIRKIAKKQRDKLLRNTPPPPVPIFKGLDANACALFEPLQSEWKRYGARFPSLQLLVNATPSAKPFAVVRIRSDPDGRRDIMFEDEQSLISWFHRNDD